MTSAAHKVASTTELIQSILVQTDMRTLLVSVQRVCKGWKTLVETSRPLQRALYFEAIPPSSDKEITAGRTPNPLLMESFPIFFRTLQGDETVISHYAKPKNFTYSFSFMDEPRVGISSQATEKPAAALGASRSTKREAYLRKDVSWRRMQVQHPAAPNIGFTENRARTEPSYHTDILSNPSGHGVTMGILYDIVYQFMGQWGSDSGFCVHWRDLSRDPKYIYWPLKAEGHSLAGEYDFPDSVGIVVIRRTQYKHIAFPSNVSILRSTYRPEGMQLYKMNLICRYFVDMFG